MPKRSGFTLVELLVVISIISVLSMIGIVIYSSAQKNARDARRRGDLEAIRTALAIYKSINGTYPPVTSSVGRSGWGESNLNPTNYINITSVSDFFASGSLPVDPINNSIYRYAYYRYSPSEADSYGCSHSYFYVIGIRKFESSGRAGGWKCSGRDWGTEFDYVVGDYE